MTDAGNHAEQAVVPTAGKSNSHRKFRAIREQISKLVGHQPNHRHAPPPKSILKQPRPVRDDTAEATPTDNALVGYTGPVHNRETGQTVWAGSHPTGSVHSLDLIYPDGHRSAQQQWSFQMSGGVTHTVPHHKWMEMDAEQQKAFNNAGLLPLRILNKSTKSKPAAIAQAPPPPPAIESGSTGACSACGNTKTSAVKKFLTHGGLMRALCSDCVYDRNGGDQGAFSTEWATGRPL